MAEKFKSFGLPPTADNSPSGYSIPAVRMPDGSYIMDSRNIADALEALKPEPSLRLDSGYVERTQEAVLATHKALAPNVMPRIPERLLNPRSAEYFAATRAKRFGMPLEQLATSPLAGKKAWENAKPSIDELVAILHEHEDGPFVLGKTPSYADLILAGFWSFAKKLDKDGDLFERGMGIDGAIREHWEACQCYLERDDH